jgi:hypothetical protein
MIDIATTMPTRARLRRRVYFFETRDGFGHVRRYRGRLVSCDGLDLALFPSGVLARLLGRSVQSIYRWEKERGFPRPSYVVFDPSGKRSTIRYYSLQQLTALASLYQRYGGLRGRHRFSLTAFITAASSVCAMLDNAPHAPWSEIIGWVHAARHLAGERGFEAHRPCLG